MVVVLSGDLWNCRPYRPQINTFVENILLFSTTMALHGREVCGISTLMSMKKNSDATDHSLKVRLTAEEIDRFAQSYYPIPKSEAVTRIVRWFMGQPDVVRKGVLGTLPEGMDFELAKAVLENAGGRAAEEAAGLKSERGGRKTPRRKPGSA